jgi:hypothetical protein
MARFSQTVAGSSATTGRSVVRLGDGEKGTKLELPAVIDGVPAELLKLLNERFRQVEIELERAKNFELSLATKSGYGELTGAGATAKPIPGAKLTLDKIGTWELRVQAQTTAACEVFPVVDPLSTETAKKQGAIVKTSGAQAASGSCLFTTTTVPRLVQLYAKGAGNVLKEGTRIDAVWLGRFVEGNKRFGRQQANQYAGATDANGDPLTDHGEEARYPSSDHPDTMPEGVDQPAL